MLSTIILYSLLNTVSASPIVRTAPQECPLTDGNLLTVKLFIKDASTCSKMCQDDPRCHFYKFYQAQDGKPPQCFFYDTCGRTVYEAPPECVMSKENCISIRPFITSDTECLNLCQKSRNCGYYKYIKDKKIEDEDSTAIAPTGRQIAISRLTGRGGSLFQLDTDADTPEFCYLLSSCSKRIIENLLCTVGQNNLLDVKLFTPSLAACRDHCEASDGCRYYYWYPISYSSAPLYCYLFRQCASQDDEPTVALIMGGRHPGHYFMDKDDFNDIVTRTEVCPVQIKEDQVEVTRAGGVSLYNSMSGVILCGGRNGNNQVLGDCLQYNLTSHMWKFHSNTIEKREEASMAFLDGHLVYIGGVGHDSVEILELRGDKVWIDGPSLPDSLARSCAVTAGSSIIVIGGHSNDSTQSLDTVLMYESSASSWTQLPVMLTPRRDHACIYVELETSAGVLVTGGLGLEDEVLSSAEFYDINTKEWHQVHFQAQKWLKNLVHLLILGE